jgi:hypothetical protein
MGGVVSYVQDGQELVIICFSKILSKGQSIYCVITRELLVILKTFQHFHKYLCGQEFHLRAGHSALTWLSNFKKFGGRHLGASSVCWSLTLRLTTVRVGSITTYMHSLEEHVQKNAPTEKF